MFIVTRKNLSPLLHQMQRVSGQCNPDGLKIGHSVLLGSADKAHDLHIVLGTFYRAEAAGNLLLVFAETDGSLRFIIGEGDRPVRGKAQNIPLVVPQPLQQAQDLAFSGASTLPFRLLGREVICFIPSWTIAS